MACFSSVRFKIGLVLWIVETKRGWLGGTSSIYDTIHIKLVRESILDRTIVTMTRAMTLEALSQTVVMNYAEQQESTMQLRASMTNIEEKFTDLYILLTKTHRNRWWTILIVVRRTAKIRYSILNWNLAVVLGLMR